MSIEKTTLAPSVASNTPPSGDLDRKRLRDACQDFESCLTRIILKSMNDSIMRAEDPDQARETYEDMFQGNLAQELSRHTTGGIADLLYQRLSVLIQDAPRADTPPSQPRASIK